MALYVAAGHNVRGSVKTMKRSIERQSLNGSLAAQFYDSTEHGTLRLPKTGKITKKARNRLRKAGVIFHWEAKGLEPRINETLFDGTRQTQAKENN